MECVCLLGTTQLLKLFLLALIHHKRITEPLNPRSTIRELLMHLSECICYRTTEIKLRSNLHRGEAMVAITMKIAIWAYDR